MKKVLVMDSGSFYAVGGAIKASFQIYTNLKNNGYAVAFFGDLTTVNKEVKTIAKDELLQNNYDIIFMNSIRDVLIIDKYMQANPNTKVVYTDRANILVNRKKSRLKSIILPKMIAREDLLRRMKKWLTCYVAITKQQEDHAWDFFKNQVRILYIPIAADKIYRKLDIKKTFDGALNVGRLDERQKKLIFMIRAIKKLVDKNPEFAGKHLIKIVGDGLDMQRYKNLVRELKLEKNLSFEGAIYGEELVNTYNNSAFLVSTSEWESPGRVFIEAMACGLPSIANTSNNVGVIKDGSNGLVYKYGDTDDFIEKFLKLYTDGKLRDRMSANALEEAKNYSLEKNFSSYEKLAESI